MSEYASLPRQEKQETILENTLFDDSFFDEQRLDDLADKRGSYDQAYRDLGVTPPEYTRPRDPEVGAAVELGSRAVKAVENIMSTYNQLNKTRGARTFSGYTDMNRRYHDVNEVVESMGKSAARKLSANDADWDYLNDTDGMRQAGFSEAQIARQKASLNKDILNKFGPGKTYAPERAKFVRKVTRTVKNATQS